MGHVSKISSVEVKLPQLKQTVITGIALDPLQIHHYGAT